MRNTITAVKLLHDKNRRPDRKRWTVEYIGIDGKKYWKQVTAPDELSAYMVVAGIRKEQTR